MVKRNLFLIFLILFLIPSLSPFGFAQVNEYYINPVDLVIGASDSLIQVNINIHTIDSIQAFVVPLYAEGTCNPFLDTMLTGGLSELNPPGFAPPSLVSGFYNRIINQYGPPSDPLHFTALDFATSVPSSSGLFCRMFYRVTGPGNLTFRTAVHSTAGAVGMWRSDATQAPVNWPAEGVVGSFEVTLVMLRGDANGDGKWTVADAVYLINYLFKFGTAPTPIQSGDANCDGKVTIADIVYLVSYLFKFGPQPCI